MQNCDKYDPDNVFKTFELIEFPICFVGLTISKQIKVERDLYTSAYFKTMHEGTLKKFEEAREVSASHRAFIITIIDNHTIEITFKPTNECIVGPKQLKNNDNRFVVDLRLIHVDGIRCCNNEWHAEIGRYYISGQFEYIKMSHKPKVLDFGEVSLNKKMTTHLIIRNDSKFTTAKVYYLKSVSFEVLPQVFCIKPASYQEVLITVKPNSLKVDNQIEFRITNPNESIYKPTTNKNPEYNDNIIPYKISCKVKVICSQRYRPPLVKSLHTLQHEPNPSYTYIEDELSILNEHKKKAFEFLIVCKMSALTKDVSENRIIEKDQCYIDVGNKPNIPGNMFCKPIPRTLSIYDVFFILPQPTVVDFGRVGLESYAENEITIENNSMCDITLDFFQSEYIYYTERKERTLHVKLKAMKEMKLILFCFGHLEGNFDDYFEYTINKKYYRQHSYTLQIGNACLMLSDKSLKFGMVTMEAFITSLPIKMHNYFNVTVDFTWNTPNDDMPFEVVPSSGSLPGNTCRMCNVIYNCRPTKAKIFEIDLNLDKKVIPVELYIVTRKLSIKFLKTALALNDIALNLETVEKLKLENSSREVAFFYVVEPLLPGIKVEPMSGVIGPKMIIPFDVIVKISCVIEFNFDLVLKINNKENVVVPVSGNVVEPKLNIQPKNVYMSRIPCKMLTYVQVVLQNTCNVKSEIEVIDSDDEIFNVYYNKGNEKCRLTKFDIEGGQSKTIFIQVQGTFRREYDFYMPFRVNGLIGPPDSNSQSHDLRYYIEKNVELYENNPKVKIKSINKEISFCRINGVISLPQLEFSVDNFEIFYKMNANNSIEFTMKNVSKQTLHITILISKIAPNFSLNLTSEENLLMTSENYLKFELITLKAANFCLKFHPKGPGRFVSVALLYLGTNTTPYYNLTFVGVNEMPTLIPSKSRITFPATYVGKTLFNIITFTLDIETDLSSFSFASNKQMFVTVELLDYEILENDTTKKYTSIRAKISVYSEKPIVATSTVTFRHSSGSSCDIEIKFCFTYCPLTLHVETMVHYEDNPYPYYPEEIQIDLYNYMEKSSQFLERWMFYQGFRKELYPKIPETLNALSIAMTSQAKEKSKGINVSYLNFIKRIAGPLLKHIHKVEVFDADETVRQVKDIHGVYGEIIKLLKSRGANIWALEAKFLLSYDQFVIYVTNVPPKNNADKFFIQEILSDVTLFKRLNKQCWIDFILQSYKVFILDSCFFDCVCVSSQPRDILNTLINWYNDQLRAHYAQCLKGETVKCIKNITTDLCDGIAIIAAFLNHCSFLKDHFSIYSKENECKTNNGKINNACLIIEAINQLRLNFPIGSLDFLEPNFLQMFFLSITLYVALPMFKPKDIIIFNPPLLKSSTRKVSINPASQESLTLAYFLLDNSKNTFSVEKIAAGDSGKKVAVNVTYNANFVDECKSILLVHGYNKTRIFDTYIVFMLSGRVETFAPLRKCKVSGPNYRQQKVDVFVSSPFTATTTFRMFVLDEEPFIPVVLEENPKRKFYATRLHLIDKNVTLSGMPKESGQEVLEHKLHFLLICLNAQISNTWIWFKSNIGEFFIKVTSQPRCDIFLDTLFVKVPEWPIPPCSCGAECECYRTTLLMIPHRNDIMIKSLRGALIERASEKMIEIFDQLIETSTGRIILGMLLAEGGTNMPDVQHILRNETSFRVTARSLEPRVDRVTLAQHTEDTLALPITVPVCDKPEKFSVTFTSECGMDVRTYKVVFTENE
ncbi:uncharacterized protein LOC106719788 [Papilio machaon]|uniref:uncharacterized protein LOC106719788 n=1 Tax=Papilio machaon TaxID=76193 RepID=UPI001E66505D|nr:uncharacterized protein LOC106719788 [Papilio machaon]